MTLAPTIPIPSAPTQATPLVPATNSASNSSGPSFGDILDAINPLQHIPVISGIYRAVTGSTISTGSQLAGDTLYGAAFGGAVLGFASSLANVAVKQVTGQDISGHLVSTVSDIGSSAPTPTPLVPHSPADSAAIIAAQNAAAATPASATAPQLGTVSERALGDYKQAQIHGAVYKHLIKMTL